MVRAQGVIAWMGSALALLMCDGVARSQDTDTPVEPGSDATASGTPPNFVSAPFAESGGDYSAAESAAAQAWSSARWTPLGEYVGDRGPLLGEGGVRLVNATGDRAVRARCEDGQRPVRYALLSGEDSVAALIEGAFSDAPLQDADGWWHFPPAPETMREWALSPETCEVQLLQPGGLPRALARVEFGSDDLYRARLAVDVAGLFDAEEAEWLWEPQSVEEWAMRYLALRPGGPHAAGAAVPDPVRGDPTPLEWEPFGRQPNFSWWRAADGVGWTVQGPARVVVRARPLGDATGACLDVNGTVHCESTLPAWETVVDGGALVRRAATLDDVAVHRRVGWSVLLPQGEHDLSVTGEVLADLRYALPSTYVDGALLPELSVVVYPPGAPTPIAVAPFAWRTVAPDVEPLASVVLATQVRPDDVPDPDEARWMALPDLTAMLDSGGPDNPDLAWLDPMGRLRLWIADSAGACTLDFPDGRSSFASQITRPFQSFQWTGESPPSAAPSAQGCDVRARVTGLEVPVPGALAAVRYVLLQPGQSARWTVDPTEEVRVILARPTGGDGEVSVDLRTQRGDAVQSDRWTLREATAERGDVAGDDGQRWTEPMRLPVDLGATVLSVTARDTVAVRISQTVRDPEVLAGLESASAAAPVFELPDVSGPADLRAASARVAAAGGSSQGLAAAFAHRARVLAALDEYRLAALDEGRAVLLDADIAPDPALVQEMIRRDSRELAGPAQWVPVDAGWVSLAASADPSQLPNLVSSASAGDFRGVASLLAGNDRAARWHSDPRPWWRRSVLGGQVLQPDERVALYADLVMHSSPSEVDASYWWPLRVLSGWERIRQVRGNATLGAELWPGAPLDPIEDALFADEWPSARVSRLRGGWELEVPAQSTLPVRMQMRCRAQGVTLPDGCRAQVLDGFGLVVFEATTDALGNPVDIVVPPGDGLMHVRVGPEDGVVVEVLLPEDAVGTIDPVGQRSSHHVGPGQPIEIDVLGPTVLRLDAWTPDVADNALTVTVLTGAGERSQSFPIASYDRLLVPIDDAGPLTIRVTANASTRLVPFSRVALADSREPPGDAVMLRALDQAVQVAMQPLAAPDLSPWAGPLPVGRQADEPSLTGVADLSFSVGQLGPGEDAADTLWRATQAARVTSRPGAAPLWVDGGLRLQELDGPGPLLELGAGVDWRWRDQPWRMWLIADTRVDTGATADRNLTTARVSARAIADRAWHTRWQTKIGLGGFARGVVAGDDAGRVGSDRPRLWSDFQSHHPIGLVPEAELRFRASSWVTFVGYGELVSNARLLDGVDHVVGGVAADLGHPGRWLRLSGDLDQRFSDWHRVDPVLSPELAARGLWTLWPGPKVGVQLRASTGYRLREQEMVGLVGVRVYGSADRALSDVRPSREPARHWQSWNQDRAATQGEAP